MFLIDTEEELGELIKNLDDGILVYGAGTVAREFAFQVKEQYGSLDKIKAFCVSKIGQPSELLGKVVFQYDENSVEINQTIIVALGRMARTEVTKTLEDSKAKIIVVNSSVVHECGKQEMYYEDCIAEVKNFLDKSNYSVVGFKDKEQNYNEKLYAWTCWWQGEDAAPNLVKACINSQRMNLPKEVEPVVITKKNYRDFVEFPDYIMEKVEDESITLTTFSDMLREKLLYEHGGIWFDATVLMHKPFPIDYFRLPLYTCKGKVHNFGSYSKWSLWCMGGMKGNSIFKFLFDTFCEYYKHNDKIKYYLTVDYFIKAAMNYVNGANDLYEEVPINNENSDKLAECLKDEYSQTLYDELTQGTYLSKLTTKHYDGRNGQDFKGFSDISIYAYIVSRYL